MKYLIAIIMLTVCATESTYIEIPFDSIKCERTETWSSVFAESLFTCSDGTVSHAMFGRDRCKDASMSRIKSKFFLVDGELLQYAWITEDLTEDERDNYCNNIKEM